MKYCWRYTSAKLLIASLLLSLFTGCATPWQTTLLVAGGATAVGAYSPDREIEQVYYLGVFDPEEQVPPTIYRLTVKGQASWLSGVRFASGWVPSIVSDSLGSQIEGQAKKGGSIVYNPGDTNLMAAISPERRMILFGPEGFREAPNDHRLVLVMGSSPQAYFDALNSALAVVSSEAGETKSNFRVTQEVVDANRYARRFQEIKHDFDAEVK